MSKEQIFEELVTIVSDVLGRPKENITLETDLSNDFDADYLDYLEIILAAEEKFKIIISDESAGKIKTIKDLVEAIFLAIQEMAIKWPEQLCFNFNCQL